MSQLRVEGVTKRYDGGILAVDNLTLHVQDGELVALLGPSGCGKTTLLRLVAGLEQADEGAIYFEEQDLASRPVHERGFGFMFQDFALFPHRSVGDNIAFGLKMAGQPRTAVGERVAEMLDLVNLIGYDQRSVLQLSGGERQRVALARSLAPRPRLLMLDEPLGSLDRSLRDQLMDEIRTILVESGVTVLYVTHDQEEAFTIADRVLVMNRGKIIQDGPPVSVYSRPRNTFVARFLGFNNLVPAHVPANAPDTIQTPIGHFAGFPENQSLAPGRHILLLRPDGAHLIAMPDTTVTPGIHLGTNGDIPERTKIVLVGQLTKKWYHGDRYRVEVAVPVTDYQFESLGQSDGERGTAGTNRPGFLHLQFELMVLHAAAEHGYRSPTSLPEMGSDICLRLHPAQLVLLPPT